MFERLFDSPGLTAILRRLAARGPAGRGKGISGRRNGEIGIVSPDFAPPSASPGRKCLTQAAPIR